MIEVLATKYDYLPLAFSKNEIAVVIDAVDVNTADRSGLKYWLEILKPKSYLSGEFVGFRQLCGNEKPPIENDGSLQYEGCVIYIDEYLDAFLEYNIPAASGFTVLPKMVQPYQVRTWAERDGVLVAGSEVTSDIQYVMKGGLSKDSYALYGSSYFTEYLAENHAFLTYQPKVQFLNKKTPQYLNFLTNLTPLPSKLKLRVELYYFGLVDGKLHDRLEGFGSAQPDNDGEVEVTGIGIYSVGVGFEQLGLHEHGNAKDIKYYEAWLMDEDGKRLTEKRRYYVDQNYYQHERAVLCNNSLGGWEVVRFTGEKVEELQLQKEIAERSLSANYLPSSAELFVYRKEGQRMAQLSTGHREDPEWLVAYEELAHAYEVYFQSRHGWVPVVLSDGSFITKGDREDIGERVFEFMYAKSSGGFDTLPYKAVSAARPTTWVPGAPYCLVDEKGLRTGLQGAGQLELFYNDVNPLEKVRGVTLKDNVPGTEGYIPPVVNSGCEVGTATVTNVAISRLGNFNRNNCPSGQTGSKGLITVDAGLYGGNTLAEANQRAEAEWRRRDNQANANLTGSCDLLPESYSIAVAADYAHFRWNSMQSDGAYSNHYVSKKRNDNAESIGNAWFLGASAHRYSPGTNDIDLPTDYSTKDWAFGFYVKSAGVTYIKIYVNGTEVFSGDTSTMSVSANHTKVEIAHGLIPSQAKVYIKIT